MYNDLEQEGLCRDKRSKLSARTSRAAASQPLQTNFTACGAMRSTQQSTSGCCTRGARSCRLQEGHGVRATVPSFPPFSPPRGCSWSLAAGSPHAKQPTTGVRTPYSLARVVVTITPHEMKVTTSYRPGRNSTPLSRVSSSIPASTRTTACTLNIGMPRTKKVQGERERLVFRTEAAATAAHAQVPHSLALTEADAATVFTLAPVPIPALFLTQF